MKKYILIVAVISLLTLTSAVYSLDFDDTQISGLNVTTDIDGAFNASQSENKTLAIIFDQDSCVYCDILKENVLSDSDVQKELNENFIVLMVDINKNPDIAQKYNVYEPLQFSF
ncbi:MAG: thioredoxin family protein [Methanobrevibacter sp.]|nr:thioredoxin family protein [Methanobrevibacter sp.]